MPPFEKRIAHGCLLQKLWYVQFLTIYSTNIFIFYVLAILVVFNLIVLLHVFHKEQQAFARHSY